MSTTWQICVWSEMCLGSPVDVLYGLNNRVLIYGCLVGFVTTLVVEIGCHNGH